MIYGYARVSTAGQDHAGQVDQLQAAGCGQVFAEAVSGAAGRKRPQLVKILSALQAGDVLMVVRMDRLARSASDALHVMATLKAKGAGFRSLAEPWADTTSDAGNLVLTIFAGFAEFDRACILARTREGRASAMARGVRMGRRPTLSRDQVAFLIRARAAPVQTRPTIPELARLVGASRSTVVRALKTPADQLADLLRPANGQLDIEEVISAVAAD